MSQMKSLIYVGLLLSSVSLSIIGCSNEGKPPAGWQKLDARAFSLFAPAGWEFHRLRGVDSYVGEFVGDGVAFSFDFGQFSDPLNEARDSYAVVHESIGGRDAKIVSPRASGHGVTGVYFHGINGTDSLSLSGHDLTPKQQDLASKIFHTIRFRDAGPH